MFSIYTQPHELCICKVGEGEGEDEDVSWHLKTLASSYAVIITFSLVLISSCCLIAVERAASRASGSVRGKTPPPAKCNKEKYNSDCCEQGQLYSIFLCSPPLTKRTKATLTLNSFARGGDGGGPSECNGKFHSDETPVVAPSTRWFNQRKRCHKSIIIFGNGRRVKATVVDECGSTKECDAEHDLQPPCRNKVVDASKAVWEALGVPNKDWGQLQVEWSDA